MTTQPLNIKCHILSTTYSCIRGWGLVVLLWMFETDYTHQEILLKNLVTDNMDIQQQLMGPRKKWTCVTVTACMTGFQNFETKNSANAVVPKESISKWWTTGRITIETPRILKQTSGFCDWKLFAVIKSVLLDPDHGKLSDYVQLLLFLS